MCGIVGFNWNDKELVRRMCKVIGYRGPDQKGLYLDENFSLGHQRLSIIDPSENGRQPICNEDESLWIVHSGEIYNFKEIRENLERGGHRFYSNTDTEVIIHAYEEYGENCVEKFNGMFAFAILDTGKRRLFLARDRLGIKPIYYYFNNGKFIFASEIKAILQYHLKREINIEALNSFFTFKYIPGPKTIFKNISKLQPGNILLFENGKIEIKEYWDLSFKPERRSEEFYIKQISELLEDSVKKTLISDVPLGVLLSGGLDSSLVTAIMSSIVDEPVKSFSVGFETDDQYYNELRFAEQVSILCNTDHHEKIINFEDIIELLPRITWHLDEPLSDWAAIPTYLVSKLAKNSVKVVLTGEGGDETFAGYRYYIANEIVPYYKILPKSIKNNFVRISKGLPISTRMKDILETISISSDVERGANWARVFSYEMRQKLFKDTVKKDNRLDNKQIFDLYENKIKSFDNLSKVMYLDTKIRIPDELLMKTEKSTMAVSLEARVPYIDHRIVEFLARIPSSIKIKNFTTKYMLKKVASKFLPREIVYRKKHGFTLPTAKWFREELRDYVQMIMEDKSVNEYLNKDYIEKIIRLHQSGRENYNFQIYCLVTFAIWHRIYIENEDFANPTTTLL